MNQSTKMNRSQRFSRPAEEFKCRSDGAKSLPLYPHLDAIYEQVKTSEISCIMADTGSGKSTLIPTHLALHGHRCIVSTPTVVSALNLAKFTQRNYPNLKIGYACGGKVEYSDQHQLVFVTAGHLYRRLLNRVHEAKPLGFDFLIMDEAHTVSADYEVLRAMIQYLWKKRDFKLIISSATLDTETISKQWAEYDRVVFTKVKVPSLPIVEQFHTRDYLPNKDDSVQVQDMVKVIVRFNQTLPPGHILVFLPGSSEIDTMYDLLFDEPSLSNCNVFAAYSSLPEEEIKLALDQSPPSRWDRTRSIIISTDICETSVTIPGVVLVLDSGRQKIMQSFNDGMAVKLTQQLASSFALAQRRGRTGRTCPGTCYRMFTEATMASMADCYPCEMERIPIYRIIVEILSYKVDPEVLFPLLRAKVLQSIAYLEFSQLIDGNRKLSSDAEFIVHLPVSLQEGLWAKRVCDTIAVESTRLLCVMIISILQATDSSSLFYLPRKNRGESEPDFSHRIEAHQQKYYDQFRGSNDLATQAMVMLCFLYEVSWNENSRLPFHKRLNTWCQEHSINSKKIKSAHRLALRLADQLGLKKWNMVYDDFIDEKTRLELVEAAVTTMSPIIQEIYKVNIFQREDTFRGVKWTSPSSSGMSYRIHKSNSVCVDTPARHIVALSRLHIQKDQYVLGFLCNILPVQIGEQSESSSRSESPLSFSEY